MAMRPAVSYMTITISSRQQTGNIITFTKFEERNLLSENRENAESGDKSDENSIMPPLISKEEIDATDSGDESDDGPLSTEMLEDIRDGSKSHPIVNRKDTYYTIYDFIKQIQTECKGALLSTRNMGKGLHKVFKAVVNDISKDLAILGESGSEVSYFIPDPRHFSEVTRFSDDIEKPWTKTTLKDIKDIINN